jgi:two-component system response regulator AtoC
VPVNCGGVPDSLLESEFFGHRKGAFTGADADKKGLFESADGGTIFLDEIGEFPYSLQVKLLRTLQESEIRMVGDSRTKKVNVRVLAATSKDLSAEVEKGRFRQDLFFRMNVVQIRLPPLRERKEDIPLLADHFLKKLDRKFGKSVKDISASAMASLLEHPWPGNVRELENCIERALILTEGDVLYPENFPSEIVKSDRNPADPRFFEGFSLKKARMVWEKELIVKALKETGGNRTRASRLLEISHPSLVSKIKDYKIEI